MANSSAVARRYTIRIEHEQPPLAHSNMGYVKFQMEQLSHWSRFRPANIEVMRRAAEVWSFSPGDCRLLAKKYSVKCVYVPLYLTMPPWPSPTGDPPSAKAGVVMIGYNFRPRELLCAELKRRLNSTLPVECGRPIWKERLKHAWVSHRLLVNIHAIVNSSLAVHRINQVPSERRKSL